MSKSLYIAYFVIKNLKKVLKKCGKTPKIAKFLGWRK